MGACPYPFEPKKLAVDPRFTTLREEQPVSRVELPFGGEAWLLTPTCGPCWSTAGSCAA
jgi:hypothetical protein